MSTELVLGTMTFGDTVDADGVAVLLDTALDLGITAIDTANGYAGGTSETLLGELLQGRRDQVTLATKAGIPHPDAGDNAPLSRTGIRRCLEASLRRLRTDHVDLFYLHQPDRATPFEETAATLAELVKEGAIRSWGVSNFAAWQIGEARRYAAAAGAPEPVVAQQLYNLLARRVEEEYIESALTTGLRTIVYNPLGGGLLTGRHQFTEQPEHGRFGDSRVAGMYRDRYWNADLFAVVDELTEVARAEGIGLAELALRWVGHQPGVDAVLVGASRPDHLTQNAAALRAGPLSPEAVRSCAAIGDRLRGPMPSYNR
ncbi:aryl-alcohol dehydrogenase-like predicted oxidoreductase [Kribbella amoyensis]|uniref:Aryl-alcohol dehydrogenase-like predicted oxidoreductase n=1 Tax=Kribbella amoyensis TaxID=996641 RepID=A0A561BTC6_9ACTN|nr:aldo/keto reductase [Kribbella amoyensis]TWD82043.1 aryl-alcohol dehydrogenase-like predicted oxidoreductase [Kribbella amoyensis]